MTKTGSMPWAVVRSLDETPQTPVVTGASFNDARGLAELMGYAVVVDQGQFDGLDALPAIAEIVEALEASQRRAVEDNSTNRQPRRVAPMPPNSRRHSGRGWKRQ